MVEDKSTIEKRLSVTNVALFGIFGLLMKKSKNKDVSFLTLKSNDGRFNHEILFSIEVNKLDLLKQENEIATENRKNRSRSNKKPLNSFEMVNEVRNKMVMHLKSL